MPREATATEPRKGLLCEDCGHHLHRPNPGHCQWRDCPCPASEAEASGAADVEAVRRDLTMADLLDTLRWITEQEGGLPEKGSEREARFIDLWTKRLRLATPPPAVPAALDCLLAKFPGDECPTFAEAPSEWCANCRARLSSSEASDAPAALDVERLKRSPSLMALLRRFGKFNDAWWDRLADEYAEADD